MNFESFFMIFDTQFHWFVLHIGVHLSDNSRQHTFLLTQDIKIGNYFTS